MNLQPREGRKEKKKKKEKTHLKQEVPPKTWAFTYVTFRESGGV